MQLSDSQHQKLWGDGGPYSEVNLVIQDRILDDRVSRRMVKVQVVLNPLTYEIIRKNLKHFENDEPVLQLIGHADKRGQHGYIASAFEAELTDPSVPQIAQEKVTFCNEVVIRL